MEYKKLEKLKGWHKEYNNDIIDYVFVLGDFDNLISDKSNINMEECYQSEARIANVLNFLEFFSCTLLVLPGNHDPYNMFKFKQPSENTRITQHSYNIHKSVFEINTSLSVIGFGGSIPGYQHIQGEQKLVWEGFPFLNEEEIKNESEQFFDDQFKQEKQFILLTHVGPSCSQTTIVKTEQQEDNIYAGCEFFNDVIKKYNKKIVTNLHGHVHDSIGKLSVMDVQIINPGSLKYGQFAKICLHQDNSTLKWVVRNNPFIQVKQGTKCIVERFGKPVKILDAGLHQINPNVDTIKVKSLKTQVIDLPSQKIITKDNINVTIDCCLYYRIISIPRATYKIDNLPHALMNQSIAAIRSVLGEMNLQDLLDKKDEIGDNLEELVNAQSQNWGTYVEQIFVKDIQLNKQTQDDMAAIAKQKRIGESKLISNKADVETARLLRETADILDSKAAMQIRYLEIINQNKSLHKFLLKINQFNPAFRLKRRSGKHQVENSCNSKCLVCKGPSSSECSKCNREYYLLNNTCVSNCGIGYYKNDQINECQNCNPNLNCQQCSDGQSCSSCGIGFFLNFPKCQQCHPNCVSCFAQEYYQCFTCNTALQKYKEDAACVDVCSKGKYRAQQDELLYCEDCQPPCKQCLSKEICTDCQEGYYYDSTQEETKRCQLCDSGSKQIKGCVNCFFQQTNNKLICRQCINGLLQPDQTQCLETCPQKYFQDIDQKKCIQCHENCIQCIQAQNFNCIECISGYYQEQNTNSCLKCPKNCQKCIILSSKLHCIKCFPGYIFQIEIQISFDFSLSNLVRCVNECSFGYFSLSKSLTQELTILFLQKVNQNLYLGFLNSDWCQKCSSININCEDCEKQNPQNCLVCKNKYYLKIVTVFLQNQDGEIQNQDGYIQNQDGEIQKTYKYGDCFPCSQANCDVCIKKKPSLDDLDDPPQCLSCIRDKNDVCQNFLINGVCISQSNCILNTNYYIEKKKCICAKCDDLCSSCIGGLENQCLGCSSLKNFLVKSENLNYGYCQQCPSICSECISQNFCLSCIKDYYLNYFDSNTQLCIDKCPNNFYEDNDQNKCTKCPDPFCQNCFKKSLQIITCLQCKPGFYINKESGTCQQCHPQCETCLQSGNDIEPFCQKCKQPTQQDWPPIVVDGTKCKEKCPKKKYMDLETLICVDCHPSCNQCTSQSQTQCQECYTRTINRINK
ncbi:spfh domain band 7 family protein [Ichthyophthirius multifiliis]|uniref:Spfh domain band 7 family protein n=1 Tax=Ichthyophthirius multifiliis TaxID=5932 RepID=G0QRA9_ICHMU|nr:spfh domain band 7 family protein [Ichthyophthirius multifiliis]EGR32261.1 spfh domain band 7 family protein [Ichthyophthirius multifiliis]|eukprot:XP_004035747.1 spfh domain band 7 family protein [Ichthyophthirius multifiliis]